MHSKKMLRRLRALERLDSDIIMYAKCPEGAEFVNGCTKLFAVRRAYTAANKLDKALEARNSLLMKPGMSGRVS